MSETDLNLTVKDLATRYQVNTSTVWRWVKAGRFPQPYRIAGTITRWSATEVLAHEREARQPELRTA